MSTHKNDVIITRLLTVVLGIALGLLGYVLYLLAVTITTDNSAILSSTTAPEMELSEDNQKLLDRIINAKTADTVYKTSIELMDRGYYDQRPSYLIDDQDYIDWRDENMPIYGEYKEASCDIPVIAMDDGVTQDDLNYVIQSISYIPENFVKQAAADGWKVQIFSVNNLESAYADGYASISVNGQTDHEKKTLSLPSTSLYTVYHEFGHILAAYCEEELYDAGLYDFTDTTELSVLYNHSALGSVYIYLNPTEQVADSFYDYIWYPREMQDQAPTLYEIFSETIENFDQAA